MKFKDLLEGIIVPKKLKITTTDIDELEELFAATIVTFEEADEVDECRAAYIPELDEIIVHVHPDMNINTLEYLIQHEIIHSIQDDKSNMRMAASIEKERIAIDKVTKKIQKLNPKKDIDKIMKLSQELSDLEADRGFLNVEEYMTYAYAFVKLRKNDNYNQTLKEAEEWWKKITGKKLDKKLLKYFGSYWLVRDEL